VPETLVETLRARDDEEGIQNFNAPVFKPGDQVRIVDGALAGYEGIFQVHTSEERVVVLLDILGQANRVQLPAGQVEHQ
jgi:transcriptional antiterminator RfaH